MKKQNIFVDCHVFDGNFQGTTTYIKGLYTELIQDKNFHFFFGAADIEFIKTIFGTHENLTYVAYKSKNKFLRLLFDIPGIIKTNKIDYAHFQYVVPPIKNCKYIVTIHDVLFLDFPKYFPWAYRVKNKLLFKRSAQCSDIVLSVSEYSKKQIQKHFGIDKITVTANAVDPVYFEPFDKETIKEQVKAKFNATDYFLYVSRWEPRKNHHSLLKVFVEKEHYKNHSLVFIGDKAIENSTYNTYYASLPADIKAKIFTFNKVDFEDLLLFVRGADLAIYPSIAEGFGIPPLESLAAGVPTICSNTTAMSDFEFLKGVQFDPLNEADLNDKIQKGLSDQSLQNRISEMKLMYSWQKAKTDFIQALKDFESVKK
ncbi:glycosyltransferase family 4 protein [Flavobacterium terrisoli]|uniref:glycosyltransferase family 4 protein n=1 Tax=Flavobacterium terrisoli TaxID=3242195 RepID=UPI002542A6D9|nr:glycosyltransferase family 1 protein [Flavobacterium buctense]